MCTCKWRQLWSPLQKFRDCITACVHANGGRCGLYFRSSGTVLLHVYMQMEVAVVSTSEVQGLYYCMCTCKWRQLWSLLQKFRDCITACVHANGGSCGLYFRSSGTVLLHVYMQMEVAVVSTSEVQGLYYCMCTCKWRQLWSLLQKFRDCITACVHANGGSCGLYFRSSGTVLLHVYMQMQVALFSTSEVQGLYYCMCTCKWRQLWSLLQKFRDCITACVHANGGSCGLYFRSSGTVLLHVYMQIVVAVVATSEVQGLYYCMCTCKWRWLWSLLQKFRDCITACVHANGGSCGLYFRSSGTVLLQVYMQMEVAVVATSEVQGLYYCMCTCKWRQLWSLLQKFRDCITACVHANGGSCGLYFRSSGTVLLHVYMQMEVAVVSTSEVQGLYYCMCTCKWRQLWSLLQKFRDCITACVHANGGSCGRYFRSSGTVLLHVYMQMKVAVVSTSEVQGLYYCMCTCKWRWLWSLLQKFRDCITACVHANGGSCGLYFRSSGTVLLHVYMQMEVAVVATSDVQGLYYCMCTCKWRQLWSATSDVQGLYYCMCTCKWRWLWSLLQKFRDCITACVHANGGSCGLYFRSSGTVLLHVYMQMEVAVVATSEVQGLYYCMCTCKCRQLWSLLQKFRDCIYCMCTCKWRQLWSPLQKFRDCITACVHANGGSCGRYFRSSGTVLLHVYMQMEVAVVSTSEVQGLYSDIQRGSSLLYCMCTCKWRQLWSLLQKFRDCITACVHANGGSCGLYFRSSGTVLLHVYMQMEVAVVSTSEVQGLYYCMCTCKWRQLWSLLQKFRDCITACVHSNGGSCGRYFRSSGTVLLHVYMQMEVAVVATSEVQGLYYCMCTCKWRQLWSLLQKFRDCITACVHANGGSCGLYFRSSGTVLLHVYMQMEVAVVATSEVQGLYYCMCTCKWRQLWSLLQKFRDCITACVHANGGSCGLYFRSSGTVLLHVYMQMEVAVVSTSEVQGLYYCMCTCKWRQLWSLLQKFRDCITACVHANGGSCGLYFRSSGTVLLHVYMQMEVAVVATSEVQGLYYCMCTFKWRQLWSLLQKFRDCITACIHSNGGNCGLYFRSSGTVLLHVYIQMEAAVVATSEVQGLYNCMCTCKWRELWSLLQKFRDCITACVHANWRQLWSLLQKFRDCITACVHANGGGCGLYFRSSGTVLLHVYMQMEVAVVSTSEVQGLYNCMCTFKWSQLWSLLQKCRDCITTCVHANGGSCGLYFRSSGTVLLHVYMQMEVTVVATSEVQGLYYCMCTCK